MAYPPLVYYEKEKEYRAHFERVYCQGPIQTFDKITVRFRKRDFDHCFFESVHTKDDTFSIRRAERIDWIKVALEDTNAEHRVGWDNVRKRPFTDRRVAIVMGNYVVIIRIRDPKADFVTAYVADGGTIGKIRTNPQWVFQA